TALNTYAISLGLAGIIVYAALITGSILLLARRWRLPFGAVTVLVGGTAAFAAVLEDTLAIVPGMVLAGVVGDGLLAALRIDDGNVARTRLLGAALPAVVTAFYFVAAALAFPVRWSPALWGGAVVSAAVVGLFLSVLTAPPAPAAEVDEVG
ncbi:MAG: hypothetical protein U0531_00090, partial [Dehalococcoidia bacterium]